MNGERRSRILQRLELIDAVADRFESDWRRSGRPPALSAYLAQVPENCRNELLAELIQIDHAQRLRRRQARPMTDYLAEFPELIAEGYQAELLDYAQRLEERMAQRERIPAGWRRQLPGLSWAVVALGLLPLLWHALGQPEPVPVPPVRQPLQLIERSTATRTRHFTPPDLSALQLLLPLRCGDRVVVQFTIPADRRVRLFQLEGDGRLQELPPDLSPAPLERTLVHFPARGSHTLAGSPGTLLLVGYWSAGPLARLDDILTPAERQPWPVLPGDTLVSLQPDGVQPVGEVPRGVGASPVTQVGDRLEQIRRRLLPRTEGFFVLALPVLR